GSRRTARASGEAASTDRAPEAARTAVRATAPPAPPASRPRPTTSLSPAACVLRPRSQFLGGFGVADSQRWEKRASRVRRNAYRTWHTACRHRRGDHGPRQRAVPAPPRANRTIHILGPTRPTASGAREARAGRPPRPRRSTVRAAHGTS